MCNEALISHMFHVLNRFSVRVSSRLGYNKIVFRSSRTYGPREYFERKTNVLNLKI